MPSEADSLDRERGMASISFVVAAALALTVFSTLANLIVIQYAAGVVRLAADQGARSGSVAVNAAATCESSVQEFLETALGGPYGRDISIWCHEEGSRLLSTVHARFEGYAPLIPDLDFEFEAGAVVERAIP